MKRTRKRKPNPNNPRSGYNSRIIAQALYGESLPKIDISDPEQIKNRICEYFEFCVDQNIIPSIGGMAQWIGIHRDTLNSWKRGEFRRETHQPIIVQAYGCIEECIVSLLVENRISSPVGIFFLKNVFGYKDRVNVDFATGTADRHNLFADISTDEAMKRLEALYLAGTEGGDQIDQPGTGNQGESRNTDHQRKR